MKKPVIGIEQDPKGERFLTIMCPDCEQHNRYPFTTLASEIRLECRCGVGFNLSAKNLEDLKENYGLVEGEDLSN